MFNEIKFTVQMAGCEVNTQKTGTFYIPHNCWCYVPEDTTILGVHDVGYRVKGPYLKWSYAKQDGSMRFVSCWTLGEYWKMLTGDRTYQGVGLEDFCQQLAQLLEDTTHVSRN